MSLMKAILLFAILFTTYCLDAIDAKYSKLIEKLHARKTTVLERVKAMCSWYEDLYCMLENINNDVNNNESCKLADIKDLSYHIDFDMRDTYLTMCADEENFLKEAINILNNENNESSENSNESPKDSPETYFQNKEAVFQEGFYKRTFNTIQEADIIDNKYREVMEKVFAFLYKKIDLNLIGDLLEEKTKICKENAISLEFIKKAQIENWNQYIAHEAPNNEQLQNKTDVLENNPEVCLFKPKNPVALSSDYKKIDILERISKKYIGEIPGQIKNIIFYFNNHKKCLENNISIHNKLLLHGRPGVGKSHLVKVLAEELELPLCSFIASSFNDKYIGESSRRIRNAFEIAKSYNKPILLFIDEIDALAVKRKDEMHNEHRATLLTLLAELQELQENKNIFVFAATNDIKSLDAAVIDRFAGSICEIKELDNENRAKLFKKTFSDRGIEISSKLALRLAKVIQPNLWNNSKNPKKRFSNRDIEYIVRSTLIKAFTDYVQNGANKHLCSYIRTAIDETKKPGKFAWLFPTYCDGI